MNGSKAPRLAEAAFFQTARGWMAIAWTPAGIRAVVLPTVSRLQAADHLADRLVYRFTAEPTGWAAEAVRLLQRAMDGEAVSLRSIPVDYTGLSERRIRIYEALRRVASGTWITYRELAVAAKLKNAARAVGSAMAKNPVPLLVPCHRVVRSDGNLGGFSADGGVPLKAALLMSEGVPCVGSILAPLARSNRNRRKARSFAQ